MQGMVTPVGGTVRVPTGLDPVSQIEAQGFGTLASRLDQFASVANKMAIQTAERQGLAFGAKNAPTLEELQTAIKTGQPVEMPGDATSISAFERAAYKGSLAVTEDKMDIAGRRYLTKLFATAAANPDMDPSTLTAKLDSAVNEFASAVSAVSPSSGAKVGKSLGMVANSQVVQFSREYMARQTKEMKRTATASAGQIISEASTIVSGYQPEPNAGTLQDKLTVQRARLESTLMLGGHDALSIQKNIERFDKKVSAEQISEIRNWAQNNQQYADDPLKAFTELRKFAAKKRDHAVPQRLQEMWKNMSNADRVKAHDEVMGAIRQSNEAARIERERDALNAEVVFDNLQRTEANLIENNDRKGLSDIVKQYREIGKFTEANNLEKFLDSNQTTLRSDEQDLTRLTNLRSARILNYGDIADAKLTEEDRRRFVRDIETQRDENVSISLKSAQVALRVEDPDLEKKIVDLTLIKQQQRIQYDRVLDKVYTEKRKFDARMKEMVRTNTPRGEQDFFDPQVIVDNALQDIRDKTRTDSIALQNKIIKTAFDYISGKVKKTSDSSIWSFLSSEEDRKVLAKIPPIMSRDYFLQFSEGVRGQTKDKAVQALRAYKMLDELERR